MYTAWVCEEVIAIPTVAILTNAVPTIIIFTTGRLSNNDNLPK